MYRAIATALQLKQSVHDHVTRRAADPGSDRGEIIEVVLWAIAAIAIAGIAVAAIRGYVTDRAAEIK